MKVADIMQIQVVYVTTETKVEDVCRLIFGRGINGVPVCKGKRLVGFITERDILSKFYPSMQEYMEDPVHTADFEAMEEKVAEILSFTAKDIMSKKPITVTADTPLLRAQSLMSIHKVGRLPVVDEKGDLIGILSKGDIFKAVVGQRLPFEADEHYHDWLSRRFDVIVDQKARLAKEIPDFMQLFKKARVQKVLDVGCGTGVHAIGLAERGFDVVGIDRSRRMIDVASEKTTSLPEVTRKRTRFVHCEYKNLDRVLHDTFDAAIFMGAALAHNPKPAEMLKEVVRILSKRAVLIFQFPNYERMIKTKDRLYDFNVRKSSFPGEREQAFLRFVDLPEKGFLTQTACVFARGVKRWEFRGMSSIKLVPLNTAKMKSLLTRVGFSNISSYGGEKGFYYDYLFRKPFNLKESDVLVVVAKR